MPNENVMAPKGMFRLVEIDISYANGFLGDPSECCTVLHDYSSKEEAQRVAQSAWLQWNRYGSILQFLRRPLVVLHPGGRMARQVHDDTGECVFYHQPFPQPKLNLFRLCWLPQRNS